MQTKTEILNSCYEIMRANPRCIGPDARYPEDVVKQAMLLNESAERAADYQGPAGCWSCEDFDCSGCVLEDPELVERWGK